MKNKKIFIIGAIAIIILGGGFFLTRSPKKKTAEKTTVEIPQIETIDSKKLPYLRLTPKENNHKLLLTVLDAKGFEKIEYELIYELEDGLTRGATGDINLSEKNQKEILLGTCSSGRCKYDEGVTGGELIINLEKDDKLFSHQAKFVLLQKGDNLTSDNEEITITAQNSFCLLIGGGLPAETEKEIVGGLYVLSNSDGNSQAKLENFDGTLLIWQKEEKNWQTISSPEVLSEASYLLVK